MKSIYIIQDGHGRLKIGITSDVDRRLPAIKNGCSGGISRVLSSDRVSNAAKIEKEAHSFFSSKNTSGEWFILDVTDVTLYFEANHGLLFSERIPRTRGGAGRGQGRKAIAKSGETMKARPVRMLNEEWEQCKKLGGAAWIRAKIHETTT